jgi:hypothetical protein
MQDLADLVSRLVPGAPNLSVPFAVFLLLHVPAGITCVVTGAVAAASPKRRGRHPRFGTVYYCALLDAAEPARPAAAGSSDTPPHPSDQRSARHRPRTEADGARAACARGRLIGS